MKLKNVTEELVQWVLPDILPSLNCCKCNYCKAYLIAGTLNKLKPRYVSTHQDYLIEKTNILNPQYSADIATAFALTSKELEICPKHPKFLYQSNNQD